MTAMAARLGIRLLGEFALDGADVTSLRSRQARTLLKRLALARGATVDIDSLVEAVWSDARPAQPDRDLHVLVSRARTLVGAERLVRRGGGYALLADWWDVDELENLAGEAVRRLEARDLVGARIAAAGAVALVRGDLCADEPDASWAEAPRTAAARVAAEARGVAAATALAAGQLGDAVIHASRAMEIDPYDESALRTLMRAHAAAGRPAAALAEFARVAELLAEELGVDPGAATRVVHEEILREETTSTDEVNPPAGLVGRAEHLEVLNEELARSLAHPRVVLVVGEPGIGKTALLDHWTAVVAGRDVVVLRGSAANTDGLALQAVLDALAGCGADAAPEQWAEAGGLPGSGATADALTEAAFARLDDAIDSLRRGTGTVLAIDDADRADPLTWAWLEHLRQRRAARLLVVLAVRDRSAAQLTADTVVALEPLGAAEVALLVGADRAVDLLDKSGGNPLLVTELARGDEISLREAVAARWRTTGEAGTTLQAAAVLGAVIDLDLLAATLDCSPLDVLEHLDVGLRQALLVERDARLTFRHELVRLTLEAAAGLARRAWLHRRASAVLGSRPDSNPLELARHARAGGDRAVTACALARAAELAQARLDLAGAERLLDEALATDMTTPLLLRRSRVRMARGDLAGADEDAEAARATDDTGEALELRAWVARNRHDLDGAIRLGRAAADVATDPAVRSSSLIAVAFGHRGNGDLRRADAVLAQAAGGPADLGLPAWTGVLRVHQGRPAEALATLEPMLGVDARRGVQAFWVEHTLQMTAHAYGLLGRAADALRVLDRLEQELRRRGTEVRYAGLPHTYRSWVLRNLGDPDATQVAHAGLEVAGSQEILAQSHLDLADCLLRAGDLTAAAARLDRAASESGTRAFHNKWRFDQRRSLLFARLALAERDAAVALEAAEPVIAGAEARGDARYVVLARLVRATASARLGIPVDAAELTADLDALAGLAALEGWWLAMDVADATGSGHARAVATALAEHVAREADGRAESFRAVVAHRSAP